MRSKEYFRDTVKITFLSDTNYLKSEDGNVLTLAALSQDRRLSLSDLPCFWFLTKDVNKQKYLTSLRKNKVFLRIQLQRSCFRQERETLGNWGSNSESLSDLCSRKDIQSRAGTGMPFPSGYCFFATVAAVVLLSLQGWECTDAATRPSAGKKRGKRCFVPLVTTCRL